MSLSEDEREKQRSEIRRKEAIKSLHANLQLMENKVMMKEKEKDNDKRLKVKYENDMRIMAKEKLKAAEDKFARARITREYLDAQVSLKTQNRFSEALLSQREIALNKVLCYVFIIY